ncbi:chemotaxis protein CheD [Evansella cellulosilytica]|uniref:Probable chemoreceptor glutamine deamidase CheD n=1 Tax=Evansella cellulosilytica (strain ATCC 21833 / DSM 2522 / FERM P-1141 / JCM 9156 / N-4) TaxID=649639 RepID=E6TSU1_EVAC2|nr:chemotaxis protein CheD [Evansella cellulosilytica]ADU30733.1 CheD [Evansella cellulosilytica DSM 2522]
MNNTVLTGTVIKVGMADLNFANPPNKIRTSGLGSCVGIIIYDEYSKMCGMAHVMLPESSIARNGKIQRAKYADTALEDLIKTLITDGALPFRLKAKIAGGAQMFQFSSNNDTMRIGPRNVEAVRSVLKNYNVKILSEDVGGNSGRTIEFDPQTCMLEIRTVNKGVKMI